MLLTHSGDFIIVFILGWFACVCMCAEDSTCDQWDAMAKDMTGSGEYHKCVTDKTQVCSRFDCEGSLTETISSAQVPVDYCFGLQLNSCLEPLSMDFYLKLPSVNYSNQFRISHDQPITLTTLDIPQLEALGLMPLLDFEFERDLQGSVLVSITLKVKTSSSFPITLDRFQRKVLEKEELPIQHCSTKQNASSDKPDKDFMSVQCHAKKYPSQQPKVSQPSYDVKPSKTLTKTCSIFAKKCSEGETCELTSGVKGVCNCEPDFSYMAEKNACVSQGRIGMACSPAANCGVYEECKKDAASGAFSCRCEESFYWDKERKLCILDAHKSSSHKDPSGHDDTKGTTTQQPTTQPDTHASKHKTSSDKNKYIIIGGALAGVVVILVVLVGGFIFCRRGRRNRFRSGGSLHDSDNPLLADTDDDVDLVM